MLLYLPLSTLVVQTLHHCQGKISRFWSRVGFSRHPHTHFIQSRIAERDGGITIIQQFIDLFSLPQPCQCAVLPQDRRHIRNRSFETFMTAPQRPVAHLQPLI